MSTEPEDFDLAGMAARYWDHCDGLGDFEAFIAVDDVLALGPTTASIPLLLALLEGATDESRMAYFAAGPLTDLIHMEDERIDESLRALIEENARLRRAMSFTQIGRGERSLRFGRRTS